MQFPNSTLQLTFLIFVIGAGYSVEALTCFVCSSDTLASCATLQMKDLPFKLCPSNTESCFSRIENGVTLRGCSTVQTADSLKQDHYITCKVDKCNGDIFPEDRLHCLHCAGSSCINQTDTIDVRHPCVNFDRNDKCYRVFSPDGKFAYRGCGSEPGFGKTYCEQHAQQCSECSENGCNAKHLEWAKEKLSCIKCKSVDGKKCDEIDDDIAAEECAPVVEGYQNKCYTYAGKDGVERGCLYEASVNVRNKCTDNRYSCTVCKESGCNRLKAVKPKKCYVGEMEPGQSFAETDCKFRGDSCFTYINKGIVIKGCKVEYLQDDKNPSDIFEKLPKTMYDICEPSLCNSRNIQKMECFVCESKSGSDPECVSGNSSMTKKCSLEMEPPNCYHYIDDVLGLTKRGCVSDLKNVNDMLNKCKENGDHCKQCDHDHCNMKPAFSKCLGCKYSEDPNCAIDPSKSNICKLYEDQCFTLIESKNVIRGCLSESEYQDKCLNGDKMCAVCDPSNEANCNKQKLELEQCIECDTKNDGLECRKNPEKFKGGICNGPQPAKHEGCFVSIVGDHVQRGCISKLSQSEKEKCLHQSSTCKSFSGTNSNNVISFHECYKCNSRDDPTCSNRLVSPYAATEICEMTSSNCTTGIDKHGVTHRRCSKDQSVEEKAFKHYKICNGTKCNSEIFPKNRYQCYQCNGDSDCDLSGEKHKKTFFPCNVYSDHNQCYTYQDKTDKIHRGCLSDSTDSRLLCEMDPSKCVKCKKSGCNNQPKGSIFPKDRLQCYRCSGGSDCDLTNENNKNEKVHCDVHSEYDQCYTYQDKEDKIHRGCLSDVTNSRLLCELDPSKCVKCKVPGCNNQPKGNIEFFPKDRLQCYRCSGNSVCDFTGENGKKEKVHCSVSSKHDQCYTYMDNNKEMHRGCLSDASDSQLLCVSKPSKCVKCKNSACNDQPKLRKPSLSCVHCNDDKDCGYEQDKTKSKACSTEMVPYNIKEACYARTVTKETDKKSFERGCATVDLAQEIPDSDRPEGTFGAMCFESGCNTRNIKVDQCQKCSSKLGEDCSIVKGKNFLAKCGESYSYSKRGCFTYVKGDQVERGCVMDLNIIRHEECLKNPNACVICKSDGCNNEDRNKVERSFGHRMTSTILLNVFIVFVVYFYN